MPDSPDAILAQLTHLAGNADRMDTITSRDAMRLVHLFRDLDAHLTAGGELPADWHTPDPMQRGIFGPADADADRLEYEVGDADPTPGGSYGLNEGCLAEHDGWSCTWHAGHRGAHIAGDSRTVLQVWADR